MPISVIVAIVIVVPIIAFVLAVVVVIVAFRENELTRRQSLPQSDILRLQSLDPQHVIGSDVGDAAIIVIVIIIIVTVFTVFILS